MRRQFADAEKNPNHLDAMDKLIRGAIIIRTDDVGRVTEFLEQHSAEYHVRVVELPERDREVMELLVE